MKVRGVTRPRQSEQFAGVTDDEDARILYRCQLAEGRATTLIVPSSRRVVPEVEAAIDAAWAETNRRPGVTLFDGPVCRLEGLSISGPGVRFALSTTSYRINVGTNFCNPKLADQYGPDVMANPLGVSAGLISSDGFLIFGRRNGSVAYYPQKLHPFAGSIEVRDAINIFDDCRRELREEIGMQAGEVADIHLIGLVEDRRLRHPELIFRVRSTLTRDAIQPKVDPAEHAASEAWPATVEGLTAMLTRDDVTPVGRAIGRRLIELL